MASSRLQLLDTIVLLSSYQEACLMLDLMHQPEVSIDISSSCPRESALNDEFIGAIHRMGQQRSLCALPGTC